jgi:hypothetical protein
MFSRQHGAGYARDFSGRFSYINLRKIQNHIVNYFALLRRHAAVITKYSATKPTLTLDIAKQMNTMCAFFWRC